MLGFANSPQSPLATSRLLRATGQSLRCPLHRATYQHATIHELLNLR
jgi:hypothetical protein